MRERVCCIRAVGRVRKRCCVGEVTQFNAHLGFTAVLSAETKEKSNTSSNEQMVQQSFFKKLRMSNFGSVKQEVNYFENFNLKLS